MEGKKGFELKWPWNWLLCGVFVAVAGWFIGYLWSALLAALFLWWQKKRHPNAVPQGGYCLDRTRKRLIQLVWALLCFLIAAACGVYVYAEYIEGVTDWETKDYVILAVAAVVCLGAFALGCYEAFTGLRDALFPGRSRLAQSIRAQLPYPDEAPDVSELFAMVDRDIQENGQWFDRVAVGRQWIFGDEVTALDRVRVVFGRNEVVQHHGNGRVRSDHIIELHILDDRRQTQVTSLRSAEELQPLLNCIHLRAPNALIRPYAEIASYNSKTDEEWQELEREYQARRTRLTRQEEERESSAARSNPDFVFIDPQGQRTSRFGQKTIDEQLRTLSQGRRLAVVPVEPLPVGSLGWLVRMECGISEAGPALVAVLKKPDGSFCAFGQPVELAGAENILSNLIQEKQLPSLELWQPVQAVAAEDRPKPERRLTLTLADRTGGKHTYEKFTRRDVELAAQGLGDGKYFAVCLAEGSRYLHVAAGTVEDGRCTVNLSRPDPDKLRVFELKCTHRKAGELLLSFLDTPLTPGPEWQDVTRRLEKQSKK